MKRAKKVEDRVRVLLAIKEKDKWLDGFYRKRITYPIPKKERERESGWCYVLYNPNNQQCKIGHTRAGLMKRVAAIQSQSGTIIKILLAIETQEGYDERCCLIERVLHAYFHKKRNVGEWFSLSIKDVLQIRNLFYSIEGEDMQDNIMEVVAESKHVNAA